eukprot:7187873-Pyramimonas_sp.AAC.1
MTVQAPLYVVQATWDALTRHDSQDSNRKTRSEGPGSRRTRGRERRAGEGCARGRTVSAAAAEGRWQGAVDDDESNRRKPRSAAFA